LKLHNLQNMRKEHDFLGEVEIPDEALYGIHSARARSNFPDISRFSFQWYKAVGLVKLACYNTYSNFRKAVTDKYDLDKISINLIDYKVIDAMKDAAREVSDGLYYSDFIVPAVQGGAGTSINMNVNEIITNAALIKMGLTPGNYSIIDPIETANIYQSTNDVIPTSLKVCLIQLLVELEESINELRQLTESIEGRYRNNTRIAYTQMQEAVPSTYGKLFGAYNDAFSRDWWRVSKCFERLKLVNLGGSAVGTGMSVPRFFIMTATQELQTLTGLPITRSENLSDATQNLDSLVEVHAILKAHAVNLEKIVSDIRLLASDLNKNAELVIPQRQVGSSIMPGKVNPVIVEFVISCAHKVYTNDALVSSLAALGCLDLNAYIPSIGHAMIESIQLLMAADQTLKENLFSGLIINTDKAQGNLYKSPSITTILSPYIGYHKAALLAKEMKALSVDVFEANKHLNVIQPDKLANILLPENLNKLGFTMDDVLNKE
jgi:aspartate ammonia-lyase